MKIQKSETDHFGDDYKPKQVETKNLDKDTHMRLDQDEHLGRQGALGR